jgi:hypothetical protein
VCKLSFCHSLYWTHMPACSLSCRVLVVGCSSAPWLVPKKDESAFLGFWSKMLHLPLPDYAARRVSLFVEAAAVSGCTHAVCGILSCVQH